MTAAEAYRKFTNKFRNNLVVVSCREYDSRFVFQAVPEKYAKSDDVNEVFDSLYSIEKATGMLTKFKPTDISIDEYKRGKRLPIYDKV